MKEFGGYLPIDTRAEEYFIKHLEIEEQSILRVNAARYAIAHIAKVKNYGKVWLPYYICKTVYETLENEGIEYESFNISDTLEPMLPTIQANEVIVITNYFGIMDKGFTKRMILKYKNVIFDNTQSFFCEPIMKKGVYNVYSPRKFVGVSDGAYVISLEKITEDGIEHDYSSERIDFLFRAYEYGTNCAYERYLRCEEDISGSGIRSMSAVTRALLGNVDYEMVNRRRRQNYEFFLSEVDENLRLPYIQHNIDDMWCPMIFPIFIEHNQEEFRKYMVQHKIYVPQWWKWVLDLEGANDIERKLSTSLFPIPIDQRYNPEDLQDIVTTISVFLKGNKKYV